MSDLCNMINLTVFFQPFKFLFSSLGGILVKSDILSFKIHGFRGDLTISTQVRCTREI